MTTDSPTNGKLIMKNLLALALSSCLALFADLCAASEETMLEVREFSASSFSSDFGPVSVRGAARDFGLDGLEVRAFGKDMDIPNDVLGKFNRMKINGIALTIDGGTSEKNRGTLVIIFSSMYSAGAVEVGVITITRSGAIDATVDVQASKEH